MSSIYLLISVAFAKLQLVYLGHEYAVCLTSCELSVVRGVLLRSHEDKVAEILTMSKRSRPYVVQGVQGCPRQWWSPGLTTRLGLGTVSGPWYGRAFVLCGLESCPDHRPAAGVPWVLTWGISL
ncbi:hypothetical protein GGR55DRAFT_501502 [Xylaria sp. FL0064]|nr:hypothetical protein GGR55DRAFT_501502 [Xylaria sp. FL0064]